MLNLRLAGCYRYLVLHSMSLATLNFNSLKRLPSSYLAKPLLSMIMLAAITFPSLAQADYLYTYTGNPFQAISTEYFSNGDGTSDTVNTPFQTSINAEIRTKELFTIGYNFDNITSLRYFADGLNGTVEINYPFSTSPPETYPTVGGHFNISSVDENGLPTTYHSRFGEYIYEGGRHLKSITISDTRDDLYGYDENENWVFYSGGVSQNPGVWQVAAVSPVPEPETYAMMLAGLGMIGFVSRRKQIGNQKEKD